MQGSSTLLIKIYKPTTDIFYSFNSIAADTMCCTPEHFFIICPAIYKKETKKIGGTSEKQRIPKMYK